MENVLKIGIIGCGAIGKDHCRRIIETVPGATVVAVSDYVAAAADDTAAKYGIKSYGNDCDGMIKDPEVEAVVITSIDPTHHDYVMKTLAEEKWCFCEKPLSQNAADCEDIIKREQEIGKRLVQVGFMRHYDRGYAEMKRIIASGELGKPLIIKACHRNVSQGPGFKTENGVTNVAIHELDICRWLLGDEYEDVQCVKVRQSSNSDKGYDNPQVMLMRTKKGCFIDVEVQVADGYGYAAEGDATAAMLMAAMLRLCGQAGFSEMDMMDFAREAILLCHAGEGNWAMCRRDKKPFLMDQ